MSCWIHKWRTMEEATLISAALSKERRKLALGYGLSSIAIGISIFSLSLRLVEPGTNWMIAVLGFVLVTIGLVTGIIGFAIPFISYMEDDTICRNSICVKCKEVSIEIDRAREIAAKEADEAYNLSVEYDRVRHITKQLRNLT